MKVIWGGCRKGNRGWGQSSKIVVIGVISRKGKVQIQIIKQADVNTIHLYTIPSIGQG